MVLTYAEGSPDLSFFSWIYMHSFAGGLSEITGYIENPQVSQGIDIVYFPNCCTSFFTEAESDLEGLFSMYKNDIVESGMEGNEMR